MENGQSLLGLGVFILFCWAISEGRRQVSWRLVGAGVVFQIALALLLLKVPAVQSFFFLLNHVVLALKEATGAGTTFVFGYLGGGSPPFDMTNPGANFILTFQTLPILIVLSALSSLLFYWRVLPFAVKLVSKVLEKTLGVGGAVGVAAAANIFVGMVEAPLFVRPYIKSLSRSELFVVMTCGMATIAGTVMVIYATFLTGIVDNPLGQILTASLISAPAAIITALIMVPGKQRTDGAFRLPPPEANSAMEAITIGTVQGVELLINVVALLLVMVALVALVNTMLGVLPDIAGAPLTIERMLGWIMAPVCWLMGIPWAEAQTAGTLMGVKTVLTEFMAYLDMSRLPAGSLSPRSSMIMTYALCGFANLSSMGIMIGGLIAIAPERRKEIVDLSGKSILSGTIATCMTGAVVGLLVW